MQKISRVMTVCKNCGAVGKAAAQHCVCCGAAIGADMRLYAKNPWKKTEVKIATSVKKKMSVSGILSVVFAVLGVIALAVNFFDRGILIGLVAMVFGLISLAKKNTGWVLATIGLALSFYLLFVNMLYFFHPLLYLF